MEHHPIGASPKVVWFYWGELLDDELASTGTSPEESFIRKQQTLDRVAMAAHQ